jgi:hypothetical protein
MAADFQLLEQLKRLERHPVTEWYTVPEAAGACRRSEGTILNLVSRYNLPRRRGWKVIRKQRRCVMFFSPATVAFMQSITLFGPSRRERKEGQLVGRVIERGQSLEEARP